MENYRNLPSWAKTIIISVAVCFALKIGVLAIVPGFVWAGVIIGGLIIGAKAAYNAYIRINNLPAEAGKWVDDRINNALDNDPFQW